jgi:hypothetical protein
MDFHLALKMGTPTAVRNRAAECSPKFASVVDREILEAILQDLPEFADIVYPKWSFERGFSRE